MFILIALDIIRKKNILKLDLRCFNLNCEPILYV